MEPGGSQGSTALITQAVQAKILVGQRGVHPRA